MVKFDYYKDTFNGVEIGEAEWSRLSSRAEDYISSVAKGFDIESEQYKKAVCAVAEAWRINSTGVLVSQHVGSWSKTYKTEEKSDKDRLLAAVRLYLGDYMRGAVEWA